MLSGLLYLVISGNFFMLFLFFTFYCTVWHVGSLNLSSPALEAQSLNHWTKREVPGKFFVEIHLGLR